MTAEEWGRITQVFERALRQPAHARAAFIERECQGDESRCRLLLSLISHHEDEAGAERDGDSRVVSNPLETGEQLVGGRFHVQARLGGGAFGTVYKAFDSGHHLPVALKLLHEADPGYLYRFKQEFRKAIQIDHPNIVRPHELFSEGGRWFFTMDLVDGVPMVQYIRGRGTALRRVSGEEFERLRGTLDQLVAALTALHNQGLLHGDIKPENVLVSPDGRVHLLDFGLVKDIAPGMSGRSSLLAGTPYYMSPEQVMQLPISEASDWYSVGVMLYEALTGQVPFSGGLYQVLSDKCSRDVTFPEGDWGPESTVQLCLRLLSRDPGSRPSGKELAAGLSNWVKTDDTAVPAASRSKLFVGRERELAALHAAFAEVLEGNPVRLDIHGLSGIGKTALIREFLDQVRGGFSNAVILSGRCYLQESVPFKALDEVVDAAARYLGSLDDVVVAAVLPRDFPLLARVFPVLQQFLPLTAGRTHAAAAIEPQDLRIRAFAALKELLARLADRSPVLIWIDDLQWGDPDSEQILAELVRPPGSPSALLLLSYRTEDIESCALLQNLRSTASSPGALRQIQAGPLDEERLCELAHLLSSELSDSAARVIAAEAGGSPLFVQELARFRGAEEGHVASLFEAIQQRVHSLNPALRRLLETLAVAGQPLGRSAAYEIAGLGSADPALLSSTQVRMLLRPCGVRGDQFDTYHDKVREAILALLPGETIREYHHQLALTLQRDAQVEADRLLRHFVGAGDLPSGYAYAVTAGGVATECVAFHRAAQLFEIALDLRRRLLKAGLPPPPGPDDAELSRAIADSLANAGRAMEAAHAYLEASSKAAGEHGSDLRLLAANQMLRGGQVDRGVALLRATLREFGVWIPEGRMLTLAAVLWMRIRVHVRGSSYRERSAGEVPPDLLQKADRLWTPGVTLTATDPLIASYIRGQHYLLALRIGEPYRISLAFAYEAVQLAMLRFGKRSRALLESAQRIAEQLNHPHAKAMTHLAAAAVAMFSGRLKEARRAGLRAEEILREECRGVTWERTAAQTIFLSALALTAGWPEYSVRLSQALKEAEMNGDLYSRFALPLTSGAHSLPLIADQPEEARREVDEKLAAWGRSDFDFPRFAHWYAKIELSIYQDRFEEAWRQITDNWGELGRSYLWQFQFQRMMAFQLRGRTAIALYSNGKRQPRLLDDALDCANVCARSPLEVGRAFSALIRAGVATCRGEKRSAQEILGEAEELFREFGWAQYSFASGFQRGKLMGGSAGRQLQENAAKEATRLGVTNVPRFCELLLNCRLA